MFKRGSPWIEQLTAATAAAAREIHLRIGKEQLYAFALFTSGEADFSYVVASANTEEALERKTVAVAPRHRRTPAELRRALRWSAADWEHHDFSPEVAAIPLPPLGPARRDLNVRSALVSALAAIDKAGAFGAGAERERVTLALLCGDMSDAFLLRGIRELNPPSVVERFVERDTPEPFLSRLASLPAARRIATLLTLWEELELGEPGELTEEARAHGVTAHDVEQLVRREGRPAVSGVLDLVERHAFGEGWFEKGTLDFARWGAARPPMRLASSAAFALSALGLGEEDIARVQGIVAKRVALDCSLACAPTLAENLARVLHGLFPRRFPKTVMGPKNHLQNPEPFLAGSGRGP